MHILVTGNGRAGSWVIRGQQLGETIGAEICPNAGKRDLADADLVVVVKRTPSALLSHLTELKKRWIFDCVDFWPQPIGNEWPRDGAVQWLRSSLKLLNPTAVVFPTRLMMQESGWNRLSLILPHHARPGLEPVPLRKKVRTVAYEGDPRYLGKWAGIVGKECERRGWQFMINPQSLTDADIGVALRDVGGWPSKGWKSNVKLANIHAAGIPAICSPECGYEETANGTEFWATQENDIRLAFDKFESLDSRQICREACKPITLESVAYRYKTWLSQFEMRTAACEALNS